MSVLNSYCASLSGGIKLERRSQWIQRIIARVQCQYAAFSPAVRQDLHSHFFACELVPIAHSEAQRFAQTAQSSGAISPVTTEREMENVTRRNKHEQRLCGGLAMCESLTCSAGSLHAWVHAVAGNLLLSEGLEEDIKEKPEHTICLVWFY